jgi:hypothetical protein
MRLSTTRARQGRSLVRTLALVLAGAAVMVGLALGPARSDDNDRHPGPQERAQYGHQPAHRAYHPHQRAPQPHGYYAPPRGYYAPPPVIYVPPPSPGISLFFGF